MHQPDFKIRVIQETEVRQIIIQIEVLKADFQVTFSVAFPIQGDIGGNPSGKLLVDGFLDVDVTAFYVKLIDPHLFDRTESIG